ncbi:MAG TPA: hypothetical protein VGH00_04345, partial [Chthoniobacterales bacterium]
RRNDSDDIGSTGLFMMAYPFCSSCPALSRASTSFLHPATKPWIAGSSPAMTKMDVGSPGHDEK